MSSQFWIGLVSGFLGGTTLGALIMAAMQLAARTDALPPRPPDEHDDELEHHLAPRYPGERRRHDHLH
jgi:hypothetical protein